MITGKKECGWDYDWLFIITRRETCQCIEYTIGEEGHDDVAGQ
jgi:hypothetical protein